MDYRHFEAGLLVTLNNVDPSLFFASTIQARALELKLSSKRTITHIPLSRFAGASMSEKLVSLVLFD